MLSYDEEVSKEESLENNEVIIEKTENNQESELLDDDQKKLLEQQKLEESRLNKPIRYKTLIKFTIPTILAALIMGGFQLITQVFASRGIGITAMAALSYVMPYFTFSMALGAMLTMGGSALAAKLKGEGNKVKARRVFTLMTLVTLATSLFIAVVSYFLRYQLLWMLGARVDNITVFQETFDMAMDFMIPTIWTMPAIMLGMLFTQFMIADGRPTLSMIASSVGAIATVGLNAIFIFVLDMGVFGLGLSTGIGYAIPAVIGAIYFTFNRKGTLYFTKPSWDIKAIGRSSLNGVGEMIAMMSMTVTTIVKNNVLTGIIGEEAVAAAAIILGLQGLFGALYFGFVQGIAPLISYNYGKQNHYRIKKLFKKSLIIMSALSILTIAFTMGFSDLVVRIFVERYIYVGYVYIPTGVYSPYYPYDEVLYRMYLGYQSTAEFHAMTVRGMMIVGTAFIFMGFNLFASGMFAAFNDGITGGILTIARTFVFTLVLTITLPMAMGIDGAWLAIPFAELLSVILSIIVVVKMGKKYKYLDKVQYKPLVEN
ncbi:MAG: MATE family efflux transporter [Firmicutes bacterium]|nr:MATE family efflux transporter [Bacillota bacterium]